LKDVSDRTSEKSMRSSNIPFSFKCSGTRYRGLQHCHQICSIWINFRTEND